MRGAELITFGRLSPGLESTGGLARRTRRAGSPAGEADFLAGEALRLSEGKERCFPHRPRAGGKRLDLRLDRHLARWRDGAGETVFELLARVLAGEKAAPGLARHLSGRPVLLLLLDRSRHLVTVHPEAGAIGLNRAAVGASRLSPAGALVAAAVAHGLRAVARHRAGEAYDAGKERARDVQNLLVLLVGIQGTEWSPAETRKDLERLIDGEDPFPGTFEGYAEKLRGSLSARKGVRLDDRVFRDGAAFDRLPGREKLRVVLGGTLAWYGLLTLGLLRLPRRWFSGLDPYYETAWWIFRAKPGGRGLVRARLFERSMQRFRSFRLLSGMEYLWSSWNPILAETCLRPVYRSAGGNAHPFLATMATFAYTALVVHPLWVTLTITGAAWLLGRLWPWIYTDTRIASRENLFLHALVIGFWLGLGLVVATSKLLRSLLAR